jgi:hypothetical protein
MHLTTIIETYQLSRISQSLTRLLILQKDKHTIIFYKNMLFETHCFQAFFELLNLYHLFTMMKDIVIT